MPDLRLDVPFEHVAVAGQGAGPDLADQLLEPLRAVLLDGDVPVAQRRRRLLGLFDLVGQDIIGLLACLACDPTPHANVVAIINHVFAAALGQAT